jgi:ATP-dependent DNA helicase RecQ
MLLSCAVRTGERFGMAYLIEVLRGARSERILNLGHDRLPTYGIGRTRSKDEWTSIGRQIVQGGYAIQDPERYNAVRVTPLGKRVLGGQERVTLISRARPVALQAAHVDAHPELFERLRQLRKKVADERNVPPYVIFHDRSLHEMASRLPDSVAELMEIPGIGMGKATSLGEPFLSTISDYVHERGIPRPGVIRSKGSLPEAAIGGARLGRRIAGTSMRETLDLFREGNSVSEIARQRNLALSTIEGHLVEALEAGEELDVDQVLPVDKREAINDALGRMKGSTLSEILDELGDDFSYAEIRMARALQRYE